MIAVLILILFFVITGFIVTKLLGIIGGIFAIRAERKAEKQRIEEEKAKQLESERKDKKIKAFYSLDEEKRYNIIKEKIIEILKASPNYTCTSRTSI